MPTVYQSYLTLQSLHSNHCEVKGYVCLKKRNMYKTKVLDTKQKLLLPANFNLLTSKHFPSPFILRSVTHNKAGKLTA